MSKKSKRARQVVVAAVSRLAATATNSITNKTKLEELGVTADLRKVLNSSILAQAHMDGLSVSGKPRKIDGTTVGELTESLSALVTSNTRRAAATGGYPLPAIKAEVKLVMSRIKHVNPAEIRDEHKLKDWNFSRIDCRGLAQMLNLYYFNERGIVLTPWVHPSETANPEMTVVQVAQVVRTHNPTRRAASSSTPF